MALILVSSAALISVLALQKGIQQWQLQASSSAQKQAFYMAEAGISDAIDALRSGGSGNVGTREAPALFGTGGYWVETVTDEAGVAHITSTGLHDGTPYRLCQSVTRPALPLASEGFFGSEGVTIGEGSIVRVGEAEPGLVEDVVGAVDDVLGGLLGGGSQGPGNSGNSNGNSNGNSGGNGNGNGNGKDKNKILLPVAPPPAAETLPVLGSNGSIDLDILVSVDGDALPGPDGSILSALGSTVIGSCVPELDQRRLPQIAMPFVEDPTSPIFDGAGVLTIDGGAQCYEPITVADGGTLHLVGPLALLVESLEVASGGRIVVDTQDGPVHLYVESELLVEAGGLVQNTTANPARFVVLVDGRRGRDANGDGIADSAVQWNDANPVQACLYAPNANVELPSGSAWTGGICALSLAVGPGSTLQLDERALAVDVRGRDLEAISWRTVAIPADERAVLALDPIATAKRDGVVLPLAQDARIPATESFRFETPEGETLTYSGASLLDLTLSLVDSLLPVEVEVDPAPEFGKYESDNEDKDDDDDEAKAFKNAWKYAKGHLEEDWVSALESGKIPQAAWDSVVIDGVLVEPIASVFGDPSVRGDIDAYLELSGHQDTTVQFLRAALDLMP
ncbi:hypothetical protein Pla163_04690 [Planctomycetes bacterium Pla163]|uniref:DUF7305 domain-containing protein n=1 Tax=Rohdeia mirabilis TaxID=2528008 RepID=A0A518CVX8_9BACT|nr:hypothetical protein Pla163_04690 [Planctomycetes bacterium Pla163]